MTLYLKKALKGLKMSSKMAIIINKKLDNKALKKMLKNDENVTKSVQNAQLLVNLYSEALGST